MNMGVCAYNSSLGFYVCNFVYVCVPMGLRMCIRVCMVITLHVCVHVCLCIYIHSYTFACICLGKRVSVGMYMCPFISI